MKRMAAVTLLALIPLAAVLAAVFGETGLPVEARLALDGYRSAQQRASGVYWTVAEVERASRPWRLTPALSTRTWGGSGPFRVGAVFDQVAAAPVVLQPGGPAYLRSDYGHDRRSLPYPVSVVWCVRLAPVASGVTRLVLVAWHSDLYNGAWIIHEPQDGPAVPSAVGCALAGLN